MCDDVHFGAVELFREGRWGRICSFSEPDDFTLDAASVCRQLGFPFGTSLDSNSVSRRGRPPLDDYPIADPPAVSWASNVRALTTVSQMMSSALQSRSSVVRQNTKKQLQIYYLLL